MQPEIKWHEACYCYAFQPMQFVSNLSSVTGSKLLFVMVHISITATATLAECFISMSISKIQHVRANSKS